MLLLALVFWFNLHLKNQAWLQQTWKMGWHVQDFVMVFLIQHSSCKSIKLDKSRNHTKKDTSRWIYLGMNWMTRSLLFVTVESCMYNPKCSNVDKEIWFLVLTLAVAALDHLIITGKTHISLSVWAFSLPVLFSEMGHSPEVDFFSQGCNACWCSLRNELPLQGHGVLKPRFLVWVKLADCASTNYRINLSNRYVIQEGAQEQRQRGDAWLLLICRPNYHLRW